MTSRLLVDIEKDLRKKRSALLQEVAETHEDEAVIEMERESELEEFAQKQQLFRLSERLSLRNSRLMQEIDSALRRLAAGKYGLCAICGEKIAMARLRALPTATLCIDCANDRERRRRTTRPMPTDDETEELFVSPSSGAELQEEVDVGALTK